MNHKGFPNVSREVKEGERFIGIEFQGTKMRGIPQSARVGDLNARRVEIKWEE